MTRIHFIKMNQRSRPWCGKYGINTKKLNKKKTLHKQDQFSRSDMLEFFFLVVIHWFNLGNALAWMGLCKVRSRIIQNRPINQLCSQSELLFLILRLFPGVRKRSPHRASDRRAGQHFSDAEPRRNYVHRSQCGRSARCRKRWKKFKNRDRAFRAASWNKRPQGYWPEG